ncbi:hypothetical protein BC937DRAFT_94722 [Endogone sp. FLAS-F59071]|nr:hypothetical protein BC937DRAFT_94722 [Endogone sp. FLAS-F59071]|eukprot:RUS22949.1 hypothetical protein BC937DRAFT_94722 [Endogone sp. FLAS-F59071]
MLPSSHRKADKQSLHPFFMSNPPSEPLSGNMDSDGWCIVCSQTSLPPNALYCSQRCQLLDDMRCSRTGAHIAPTNPSTVTLVTPPPSPISDKHAHRLSLSLGADIITSNNEEGSASSKMPNAETINRIISPETFVDGFGWGAIDESTFGR